MPAAEQLALLRAGTVDCITEAELEARLATGRPLRVKLGVDPTAADIHLGFAVVLRKLRQFQDLGHVAVVIIGDYTARVGDPSGRSATRPALSSAEIDAHADTYVEQVQRILDPERMEVRRNSSWLGALGMDDALALTSSVTVARMLERNDFAMRYAEGVAISLTELLYPLLQGLDSVEVRADVELGGTDQLFNNLMGRQLQEQRGQPPQAVVTTPLLEGIDGVQKMSKSLGNAVGISEPAGEQFGKLMRVPDELLERYLALTTGWLPDRVDEVSTALAGGDLHPNEAKRLLARSVVDLYHGSGAGEQAEAEFDRVFKDHGVPTDVPDVGLDAAELGGEPVRLARVLALAGLVPSNKEGRRKIAQGGVRIDGERVADPDLELEPGALHGRVLQVGRRAWARTVLDPAPTRE